MNKISDYKLELFVLGELPEAEHADIVNIVESDKSLQERVEKIQKENAEFTKAYPFTSISSKYRVAPPYNKSKVLKIVATGVVMAAAILFFLIIPSRNSQGDYREMFTGTELIKGDLNISIHKKSNNSSIMLNNNSNVSAGDTILPEVSSPYDGFIALISVDSNNFSSLHIPSEGNLPIEVKKGEKIAANYSFEFDSTPGSEAFILIYSKESYDIPKILDLIKKIGPSNLEGLKKELEAESFEIKLFILNKL